MEINLQETIDYYNERGSARRDVTDRNYLITLIKQLACLAVNKTYLSVIEIMEVEHILLDKIGAL